MLGAVILVGGALVVATRDRPEVQELTVPGAGRGVFAAVDPEQCAEIMEVALGANTEMPSGGAAVPGTTPPFAVSGLSGPRWQADLPTDGPTNATSWSQLINANAVVGLAEQTELLYWERAGEFGLVVYDLPSGRVVNQGAYTGQFVGHWTTTAWVAAVRGRTTVVGALEVTEPGFRACYAAAGRDGEDPPLSARDGGLLKIDTLGRAAVGGDGMFVLYEHLGRDTVQLLTADPGEAGKPDTDLPGQVEFVRALEDAGESGLVMSTPNELIGVGTGLTIRWRRPLAQFGVGLDAATGFVVRIGAGVGLVSANGMQLFDPVTGALGWRDDRLIMTSKHETQLGDTVAYLGGVESGANERTVVVLGTQGEVTRLRGFIAAANGDLAAIVALDRTVVLRAGKEVAALSGARVVGLGPEHILVAYDSPRGTTLYTFELPPPEESQGGGAGGGADPEQGGEPGGDTGAGSSTTTTVPGAGTGGEGEDGEPPAV